MKLAAGRIGIACFGFAHLCLRRCEAFISPPATGLMHRASTPSISSRSSSSTGPCMMLPLAPFAGAAAAHFIGSIPLNPDHLVSAKSQPTQLVALKEIREGIYGPYEVEVTEKAPETDFGISTFKKKEDTEEGRDKYVSVLAVLLAGSFIIPMVQYWWYVRDDDRPIK